MSPEKADHFVFRLVDPNHTQSGVDAYDTAIKLRPESLVIRTQNAKNGIQKTNASYFSVP